MIIVNVKTDYAGKCFLEFEIPDNGRTIKEFGYAESMAEAKRKMYFRLRRYMTEKLSKWIIQRQYAILPHCTDASHHKIGIAQILLAKLEFSSQAAFWGFCDMIARDESKYLELAPSQNSRMHRYFHNTILPILQFCTDNNSN